MSPFRTLPLLALLLLASCAKKDAPTDAGTSDAGSAEDAAAPAGPDASTATDGGRSDAGVAGVKVGAACASNIPCRPGFCAADQAGWPGGYCYASGCNTNDPRSCPGGSVCVDTTPADTANTGICLAGCAQDSDCRAGYVCDQGSYWGKLAQKICSPGKRGAKYGDPCLSNADCGLTDFCVNDAAGYPGGYCSKGCDPKVANVCGVGAICQDFNPEDSESAGLCLRTCFADGDCRATYTCQVSYFNRATLAETACLPGIRGAALGGPCKSTAECGAGQFCGSEKGDSLPGGMCLQNCHTGVAGSCPAGYFCGDTLAADGLDTGICFKGCTADTECRAGYACDLPFGEGLLPRKGCVPGKHGGATLYSPCAAAGECEVGMLCGTDSDGFPGGSCSRRCASDTDCGGDGKCMFASAASKGFCFDGCLTAADCRAGGRYGCSAKVAGTAVKGAKVCVPFDPQATVGDACTAYGQCTLGGSCTGELDRSGNFTGYQKGYCTETCTSTPTDSCPSGAFCQFIQQGLSQCFRGCTQPSSCREADGYTCQKVSTVANARLACVP